MAKKRSKEVLLPRTAFKSVAPYILLWVCEHDFGVREEDEGVRIAWNDIVLQESMGLTYYEALAAELKDEGQMKRLLKACT